MSKTTNKAISALLILALIMGVFAVSPMTVNAASIGTGDDITEGADLTGTQIYFGDYGSPSNPIKWNVVDTDSTNNTATLFSTTSLGNKAYSMAGSHGSWSGSDICKWLNSAGGWTTHATYYPGNGFLEDAFTTSEAAGIATYGTTDAANPDMYIPEISVNQKIVLPSYDEVKNGGEWGFSSNTVRNSINALWWLRSPHDFINIIAYCVIGGNPGSSGGVTNDFAVLPALKLNLNSVLFTSDASKASKSTALVEGSTLAAISNPPTEAALTLTDSSLSLNTTMTTASAVTGGSVEIPYSDVTTGTGMSVSLLLCDSNGDMIYYGRPIDLETEPASGTATVDIPDTLTPGAYTIKIFNEQVNAEYLTDYASEPKEIDLTVEEYTEAPTITNTTTSVSIEVGKSGTLDVTASGTPTPTYSAVLKDGSPLPNWISINETTGKITASPVSKQTAGDTVITVTASNGVAPDATSDFKITVTPKTDPVADKFTVTLNTNGGKALLNNKITVTNGKTYGSLPTPKRTGYKFKGWYTKNSGGTKIVSSTTVSLKADQTLYAQWTANKYKITFMAGKGKIKKSGKYKVSKLTKKKTYGNKYGTLPKAKRTGYKFKGWYTKKSGGKKITKNTKMTYAKNIKLYARWTPNGEIANCNWVHLRKAPGKSKAVKKYVKKGTKVAILGKVKVNGKYTWYKVKVGNKVGYIYSKYVKRV